MISWPDQCLETASAALLGPQGASAGPASHQNSMPDGGQNRLRGNGVGGRAGAVPHGPGCPQMAPWAPPTRAAWGESGAEIGPFLEIPCSAVDLGQNQRLATGNFMAPVRAPVETPQSGSGLALA